MDKVLEKKCYLSIYQFPASYGQSKRPSAQCVRGLRAQVQSILRNLDRGYVLYLPPSFFNPSLVHISSSGCRATQSSGAILSLLSSRCTTKNQSSLGSLPLHSSSVEARRRVRAVTRRVTPKVPQQPRRPLLAAIFRRCMLTCCIRSAESRSTRG